MIFFNNEIDLAYFFCLDNILDFKIIASKLLSSIINIELTKLRALSNLSS